MSKLDKIRGCLFGGAVGDALGYPVEFMSEKAIFSQYGDKGIREYKLDPVSGKALISDDTQMTLFTANGLLVGDRIPKAAKSPRSPTATPSVRCPRRCSPTSFTASCIRRAA